MNDTSPPRYPYQGDLGDQAYYTTEQAAQFLRDRGFPISTRYFGVLTAPSVGSGPKPDRRFGRRNLYLGSTLIAWAQGRCQKDGA